VLVIACVGADGRFGILEGVYPGPAAFVFWEKGPPSVLPLRLLTKAKLVDAEPGERKPKCTSQERVTDKEEEHKRFPRSQWPRQRRVGW
jgi:hypothetical protein